MSSADEPVFDASAVLALIKNEPGSDRLVPVSKNAKVSAVSVSEVLAKLIGKGMPPKDAQAALDALHMEVVSFESSEAKISASYVWPGVSLGDRCFLAAAHERGIGWTADHHLRSIQSKLLPRLEFFR